MSLTKTKIKEIVQDTALIGVSLIVLAIISYDSFIQKRNVRGHRYRPTDF
jgi:hypothetical protein